MIIHTNAKVDEDIDLLCNTLNAEAGRFMYNAHDRHLYYVLLRAQAAITTLAELAIEPVLKSCRRCEHYDGGCQLEPKKWANWRIMENRRPDWCPKVKEEETEDD